MKGTKTQKGITLVALIITIIILLILAVVAIRAVQGDGILQYARNSADKYEEKATEENTTLQEYSYYIDGKVNGHSMGEMQVTVEATETTPGKAIRKCSNCEYTEEIELCVINMETKEGFENVSKAVLDVDTVAGNTIRVLSNVTETGEVLLNKNVTIDINGKNFIVNGNLDATAADMVDGSNGNIGSLKVSGTRKLATNNSDFPIAIEDNSNTYILHDIVAMQQLKPTSSTNGDGTFNVQLTYRPAISDSTYTISIFSDGAEDNGVTIGSRLYIINSSNEVIHEEKRVVEEELIKEVYGNNTAFQSEYENINLDELVSNSYSLKTTSVMISDTGVERFGSLIDVELPTS